MENNYWKNNVMVVVDQEGKIVKIPRKENEMNHIEVLKSANLIQKDILEGFDWNQNMTGGFELTSFIAANGNAIIWPSNINEDFWMIISVPENGTVSQYQTISELLETLSDKKVIIMSVRYKKANNKKSKIIQEGISISGDYQKAVNEWESFCKRKALQEMVEKPIQSTENKQK